MPFAFLLAMQAAGMVMDYYGNKKQIEMGRMGQKVEQAGIETNIQMTRLESENASLNAMKNLRQTLGSQAAIMAARGTSSGAGSAMAIRGESVNEFYSDERNRKTNLAYKEASLKAGIAMSKLHQWTSETQLGQAMRKRMFENLPISSLGRPSGGKNASAAKPSGSFGMTSA